MRIILTVHQFLPEYASGTEILTFSVAKALIQRGHEVFVFTGFPAQVMMPEEERLDSYKLDGISVYRYHHIGLPLADQQVVTEIEYDNHLASRFFAHVVQEIQPDIIHFFHFGRLGTGLIDVAIQHNISAYFTPTDFWSVCPTSQLLLEDGSLCNGPNTVGGNCVKHVAMLTQSPKIQKVVSKMSIPMVNTITKVSKTPLGKGHYLGYEIAAMSKRCPHNINRLNQLNAIFSPSQLMTKTLINNGVNSDLIKPSAFGINIQGYENRCRPRFGTAWTMGFIGTLSPHKGCHILIQAFKQLKLPNLTLKIYGNINEFPSYYEELQTLADDSDNIKFCGTFPNHKIADILNDLDVLVVPSLWYENTPLVIYSALAAYCPIVASDFPGMSEVVIHNHNGLTFPAGDIEALTEQLRLLATMPDLLATFSLNCTQPKSIANYVDELEITYSTDSKKAIKCE